MSRGMNSAISRRSGEGIDLDITPGPHGIRIRKAVGVPSLEFRSLPIGERCGVHIANSKTREDSMLETGNVAPSASGRQEMLKNVINRYP